MRIFYSSQGDPMVLDREASLHAFALALRDFLAGRGVEREFAADTDGDSQPYTELLPGLRVQSAGLANAECRLSHDRWLELRAGFTDLDQLCRNIQNLKNGDHTHLYCSPVSLIFQADDSWPGFGEG